MKTITITTYLNHEGQRVILTQEKHNNKVLCYKEEPDSTIPGGAERKSITTAMYDAIVKYSKYKEINREFVRKK